MAAMMLKEPIIAIETAEGEALAKSFIDLSEHYGLTASRGVMLWVNLAGTAAMIYGSKILTIAKRPKQNKQSQQTNVAPIVSPSMNFGG